MQTFLARDFASATSANARVARRTVPKIVIKYRDVTAVTIATVPPRKRSFRDASGFGAVRDRRFRENARFGICRTVPVCAGFPGGQNGGPAGFVVRPSRFYFGPRERTCARFRKNGVATARLFRNARKERTGGFGTGCAGGSGGAVGVAGRFSKWRPFEGAESFDSFSLCLSFGNFVGLNDEKGDKTMVNIANYASRRLSKWRPFHAEE